MANGGQDHTQKNVSFTKLKSLLKSSPSTLVTYSIRRWLQTLQGDGGLSNSTNQIITTPANEYVQKNAATVVKLWM